MKGLDTPVLLAILHDTPTSRDLLKQLGGEELATCEINMFELQAVAAAGPSRSRSGREAALLRLRRRLTVIPVTAESVSAAGRAMSTHKILLRYHSLAWAAMDAAGCREWITTRDHSPPKGSPFRFKVRLTH
ncbi:MAG: PIN domain-containing protein [Thermoplasmata archaeon]